MAPETITLRTPDDEGALTRTAELLRDGAVGVAPTDTVYGLVALASREGAVRRVLDIKQRAADKPLPLLVSGPAAAAMLADLAADPAIEALMDRFWPGPLTMVLPRRPGVDLPLQPRESVGLRAPASPFCLALLERTGPLAAPSANFAGAPPPCSFSDVEEELLELVDFTVDAGVCPGGEQSTVLSLVDGPAVLREGAIPSAELFEALDAFRGESR